MDIIQETNKALDFIKHKKYKEAEQIYISLLEPNFDNAPLLSFLGYLYLTVKKYSKAENIFEKAYSISKNKNILEGLALSKFILQKHEEAIELYQQLTKFEEKYEYFEKLTTSIASIIELGDKSYISLGLEICKNAYKKFPLNKEVIINYSIICIHAGDFKLGERLCQEALRLDSKYAKGYNHLGFIYEGLYKDEYSAQECYKKSIKYGFGYSGYYDLGISYSKTEDYRNATRCFNKALIGLPNNEKIYLAKAFNYFKQRKFKQGYKYFIKQNDSSDVRKLKKLWDGKPHRTKTIFVFPDMSYGDHIMFMRYVPYLKNKFKKVIVYAYPNLIELFKNSFEGIEFVEEFPKYDYSVALSKLPYYLNMDFNNIPNSDGYLKFPAINLESKKLRVGICWEAGNRDLRNTIHRSININEFKPLFDMDCDFYSFQVNSTTDEYKKYPLVNLSDNFKTFADTAKYLQAMDIIISVDTSVANLAGAMNIKTFMLIPYYPDWRWFDNKENTEWYNSIKIFKQSDKNSWEKEIARIKFELTKINPK